jgi:hypothetical protein
MHTVYRLCLLPPPPAGHNFVSMTAHDALRMGPTKFSEQLSALTGSKKTVGPPPGKRMGSNVEVEKDGKW